MEFTNVTNLRNINETIGSERVFNSPESNLLTDVYLPLTKESSLFRARVGFLSFTGLSPFLKEITRISSQKGTVELIAGDIWDSKLIDSLKKSKKISLKEVERLKKKLQYAVLEQIESEEGVSTFLSLAQLLAVGRLKIKLAIMKRGALFHQKVCIFEDDNENSVVLKGSANWTGAAFSSNDEQVTIYPSWEPSFASYGSKDVAYHNKIWSDKRADIFVVDPVKSRQITEEVLKNCGEAFSQTLLHKLKEEHIMIPSFSIINLDILLENYLSDLGYYLETFESSLEPLDIQSGYAALVSLYKDKLVILKGNAMIFDVNLFPHQFSGVQRVVRGLNLYNTFVLADSVGLGKTRTALASVRYMIDNEQIRRVLILAPRKLHSQWEEEAALFQFSEDELILKSRDKLERLHKDHDVLSFAENSDLVIIDEAHQKLLNHKNKSYESLKAISRGRLGLLLTATPMHNTPIDLYNLLDLFGNGDLGYYFQVKQQRVRGQFLKNKQAIDEAWKKGFAQRTKRSLRLREEEQRNQQLLSPSTLEKFVIDAEDNRGVYGTRDILLYPVKLKDKEHGKVGTIVSMIKQLKLGIYDPLRYFGITGRISQNMVDQFSDKQKRSMIQESAGYSAILLRISILKQFDSSIYTFHKALGNLRRNLQKNLHDFESLRSKDKIIDYVMDLCRNRADLDESVDFLSTDERRLENLLHETRNLLNEIPEQDLLSSVHKLLQDIQLDISNINSMKRIASDLLSDDPQLRLLLQHLEEFQESGEKVIIFSQFTSTCRYVYDRLSKEYGDKVALVVGSRGQKDFSSDLEKKYSGDGYWDGSLVEKLKILNLFAPEGKQLHQRLNRLKDSPERRMLESCVEFLENGKSIEILVATDTLSVGQNLQDATRMIHLDLPWNPMVLEQRIGRIDRPRLVPRELIIYEYVLSHTSLETQLGLIEKLESKMLGIYTTTNFDSTVLPRSALMDMLNTKLRELERFENKNSVNMNDIIDEIEASNEYHDQAVNQKLNEDEEAFDRMRLYLENNELQEYNLKIPSFVSLNTDFQGLSFVGTAHFYDANNVSISEERIAGVYNAGSDNLDIGIAKVEELLGNGTITEKKKSLEFKNVALKFEKSIDEYFSKRILQESEALEKDIEESYREDKFKALGESIVSIYRRQKEQISTIVEDISRLRRILDLLENPAELSSEQKQVFGRLRKRPEQLFSDFEGYYRVLVDDDQYNANTGDGAMSEEAVTRGIERHVFTLELLIFCHSWQKK